MFPRLRERLRFILEMMAGPKGPARIDGKMIEHAITPGHVDENFCDISLEYGHIVGREFLRMRLRRLVAAEGNVDCFSVVGRARGGLAPGRRVRIPEENKWLQGRNAL